MDLSGGQGNVLPIALWGGEGGVGFPKIGPPFFAGFKGIQKQTQAFSGGAISRNTHVVPCA